MKCDSCIYRGLHEMITSNGGYSYSSDIPCQRCIHYLNPKDEYRQISQPVGWRCPECGMIMSPSQIVCINSPHLKTIDSDSTG